MCQWCFVLCNLYSQPGVFTDSFGLYAGGWFARDPRLLQQVGNVLLQGTDKPLTAKRVMIGSDAFNLANEGTAETMLKVCSDMQTELRF